MSNLQTSDYTKKRYILFGLITILGLVLPFIRINGNHFFLLSFDKKELHLFFTFFPSQELYFMSFMLIIMFLFIFFLTTLLGRVWCGWSCPQTIFRAIYRDLIQTKILKIHKSTKNRQKASDGNFVKKLIAVLLFACVGVVSASNLIWYFVPPEDFFLYLKDIQNHMFLLCLILGVAIFLVFDVVYLEEKFCIFICPYARVQSVMFDNDTVQVIYDKNRGGTIYDEHGKMISNRPSHGECTGCDSCVKICPTHIDIRKGMQLECINCLECVDACSEIMAKFDRKSLIQWSSKNSIQNGEKVKYIRFRTIGYVVVLAILVVILAVISSKKTNMLLNIDRSNELYSISVDESGVRVINAYTFLFENTQSSAHEYYFEVDNPDIKILKPTKPVKVNAKSKKKEIITLQTQKTLSDDRSKHKILPITIKAYATDNKEIAIFQKSIFVYPSADAIGDKIAKTKSNF